VLNSLYLKSIEILNGINSAILDENLNKIKKDFITSLNDRVNLLASAFLGAEEDRLLAAWGKLPADPAEAFNILRTASEDELNGTYLTLYSGKKELSIGWWNDFTLDGFNVLSRIFSQVCLSEFSQKSGGFKAYPLCKDASPKDALTVEEVRSIARLLGDMGAGLASGTEDDPVKNALHPNLFSGAAALQWVRTVYGFAANIMDAENPLIWTLSQPPLNIQSQLYRDRLLAASRFRYIAVSSSQKSPQRYNTYMDTSFNLIQGNAEDENLTMDFFISSVDGTAAARLGYYNHWSIFRIYFDNNTVTDATG
jgi:hypothetical protein